MLIGDYVAASLDGAHPQCWPERRAGIYTIEVPPLNWETVRL